MRKTIAFLAATILGGILSIVGLTAPAHASDTGFSMTRDSTIVVYEGCHDYPVSYFVPDAIASSYDWSIDITVYDPAGTQSDWDYVYSGEDPASGSTSIFLCDHERPGTWRIDAQLDYYGIQGDTFVEGSDHATDQFGVRLPRTRTSVRVNDNTAGYGQKLTFTVGSTKEYASGYFSNRYQTVVLQKYVGGSWQTIGRKATGSTGKASFVVTWKHRRTVKVRAVTPSGDYFTSSYSSSLNVY